MSPITILALTGTLLVSLALGNPVQEPASQAPTTAAAPAPTTEEPAETCRRMSGAISVGINHYIFFGNEVSSLNDNMKQIGQGDSYQLTGAPWPDAAFIWSGDRVVYIFSDKYVFSFWTNYAPADAYMFGGQDPNNFFKDGLDAAGNLDGKTVFFKGCKYVESGIMAPSAPKDLWEGVPCDLDAALTVGKDLWLFKYDKTWKVTPEGLAQGMPVETSSLISFDNIKLCKEE